MTRRIRATERSFTTNKRSICPEQQMLDAVITFTHHYVHTSPPSSAQPKSSKRIFDLHLWWRRDITVISNDWRDGRNYWGDWVVGVDVDLKHTQHRTNLRWISRKVIRKNLGVSFVVASCMISHIHVGCDRILQGIGSYVGCSFAQTRITEPW